MTIFSQLWQRLDRAARIGLVTGLLLLAGGVIAASMWLLRADYQLLFGDLAAADAAAMTAELDRMKIPYRLEGGGNTILVPAEQVYKTRLKLVGRDLPLHGSVGFELFNNADIGMTEFAQKVNYQRALQGELTRTILAVEEIQAARVHLALPEQSLFKKANNQAKASVSLTVKPGKTLQAKQIQGIQRLVAASVPEVREEDVTVIDQHGVALTRPADAAGEAGESGGAGLDNKEALERYLIRKVADVLDRTFGSGQSIASVDVTFSRDQTKVTTENVLGATPAATTGVIVREHQVSRESAAELRPAGQQSVADSSNLNRDVDYQVGRRVEQVVSAPGAISKINVAVVVRQPLEPAQIDQVRDIVAMAAGINRARGDGIAVYSMGQFGAVLATSGNAAPPVLADDDAAKPAVASAPVAGAARPGMLVIAMLGGLIGIVLLLVLLRLRSVNARPAALTEAEREELLERVRQWIAADVHGPEKHI